MQDNSMDGVLLVGDSNRNYITGFTGEESFALITGEKLYLLQIQDMYLKLKPKLNILRLWNTE